MKRMLFLIVLLSLLITNVLGQPQKRKGEEELNDTIITLVKKIDDTKIVILLENEDFIVKVSLSNFKNNIDNWLKEEDKKLLDKVLKQSDKHITNLTNTNMNRRDFLKALAVTGAAFTIKANGGMDIFSQTVKNQAGKPVDLVAVMGGEPDAMFKRAIAEVGGMGKFVKKGQKVVVKPNIGWDKTPEEAANTNPILVGEIVRQCLAAGAKEVIVFDHTCDNWIKAYKNSGIEAAAKAAGAKVIPGNNEVDYKPISLPEGKKLTESTLHQAILNCDVWINVPILKHHGGANMSISMKNLMGICHDRRIFHSTDLQQCIADMCTLSKRPVLNVVDAYRVLKDNGPQGKSLADVVLAKALFLSQDIVAVDTAATKFFGQIRDMPLDHVSHIAAGQELNLGTMDIDKLNVKRVRM